MAAFNKFNIFVQDLAQKVHNLASDVATFALSNSAPVATNTVLANITEISYANCSSRVPTITSCVQTSGTLKYILADLTLTASGTVGPFRYVVLYNSTAAGGPLIGWYDYGSSVTLANAETFVINLDNSSGVLTIV